jgi:phosphoserine phosphatase
MPRVETMRPPASPRLVSFDLDGTLVRGTSVNLHLATWLGCLRHVESLEERYARGEVTVAALADATASRYRGVDRRDVWRSLADIPTIEGIEPALQALRRRGTRIVLATCTWRFAAEYFRVRYGFDSACGTTMQHTGDTLSGVVSEYVDGTAKAGFVVGYCARARIPLADCVAVGNSVSDVPMFAAAGHSIALNATHEARRAARASVDTDDLRRVVQLMGVPLPRPGGRTSRARVGGLRQSPT